MLLVSVSKGPTCLASVFHCAPQMVTLVFILAPKLVSITFSFRPEEALLVLTARKFVCLQNLYSVLL